MKYNFPQFRIWLIIETTWDFLKILANYAEPKICIFYAEFYTKNYAELELCKFYTEILISVALIQIRNFQSGYLIR